MATTVSAKIYSHHEKADGTINVKYVVYHKGERKFIDSPHFVSKRQITKDFDIKDKFVLKWLDETLDETLDDYRILISAINSRLDFFTCEQLRDYLRDSNKDIDIIEFANSHIDFLKENNREPYSRTFRKVRNSLIDYFGRSTISINEIHSNMLYMYERFLKAPRTISRINQLRKPVTTLENRLSKGGLHAHMRDLRTLFNEAKRNITMMNWGLSGLNIIRLQSIKLVLPPLQRLEA